MAEFNSDIAGTNWDWVLGQTQSDVKKKGISLVQSFHSKGVKNQEEWKFEVVISWQLLVVQWIFQWAKMHKRFFKE